MADEDGKRALRARLRARRRDLFTIRPGQHGSTPGPRPNVGAEPREAASQALARALTADERWSRARVLAGFVGLDEEPDTRELLSRSLAEGRALYLPRLEDSRVTMRFHRITALTELVAGPFGLLEPRADAEVLASPALLDLVLVPGLAFFRDGVRLGMGKGHYDRALAGVREQARPVRVGICFAAFFEPTEGRIVAEPHDVPVHAVATELGVFECG